MSDEPEIWRDDPMMAAEYVLGLLEGEDVHRAQEKLAHDERFRWRKDWWNNWFAPWTDEMTPFEPPADLWHRIEREIRQDRSGSGEE